MEVRSPTRWQDRHVALIVKAAQRQDETALTEILGSAISINLMDSYGYSAVFYCAKEEKVSAVNFLLSRGASLNAAAKGYALTWQQDKVADMLKMGASVGSMMFGFYRGQHSGEAEADMLGLVAAQFPELEREKITRFALQYKISGLASRGERAAAMACLPAYNAKVARFYWLLGHGYAEGKLVAELVELFDQIDQAHIRISEDKRAKLINKLVYLLALTGQHADVAGLLAKQADKGSAIRGYAVLGDDAKVNELIGDARDEKLIDAAASGYAAAGEHGLVKKYLDEKASPLDVIYSYARSGYVAEVLSLLKAQSQETLQERFNVAVDGLLGYDHVIALDQLVAAVRSQLNDTTKQQLIECMVEHVNRLRPEARKRFLAFAPCLNELVTPVILQEDAFGDEKAFLNEVEQRQALIKRGYNYAQASVISHPEFLKIARLVKNETEFFEVIRANFSLALSPSDLQEIYLPSKIRAYQATILAALARESQYADLKTAIQSARSLEIVLAELDRYQKLPSQVRKIRDELANHLGVDLPDRDSYVDQSSSSSSWLFGQATHAIHGFFARAFAIGRVPSRKTGLGNQEDIDFGAPPDRFPRSL
jgi:hypothetical protein